MNGYHLFLEAPRVDGWRSLFFFFFFSLSIRLRKLGLITKKKKVLFYCGSRMRLFLSSDFFLGRFPGSDRHVVRVKCYTPTGNFYIYKKEKIFYFFILRLRFVWSGKLTSGKYDTVDEDELNFLEDLKQVLTSEGVKNFKFTYWDTCVKDLNQTQ